MADILRVDTDPGLLTNRLMGLEAAVGIAHLTGRRLSMDWANPVGNAPGSRPATGAGEPDARPRALDLWELPTAMADRVVSDDEWDEIDHADDHILDWGPFSQCVYLADDRPIPHPGVREFANGRTKYVRVPPGAGPVVRIDGRPLTFYSYFFHATGAERRRLLDCLEGIRLRAVFRDFAQRVADDIGHVNVAHVRRTDLVVGIRAYASVSPQHITSTLTQVLPTDEPLLIATEADPTSSLFDPIRERFGDVQFLSEIILGDHGAGFRELPVCEDNALGAITQELAVRADRFVGTMGSTFTGLIQRRRRQRDSTSPFWYSADFTPDGPTFTGAEYEEVNGGRYTWNRVGLAVSPDVSAWLREWPEAVHSPDDDPDSPGRRSDRDLPIHTVVCTDTNPYGDWQCQFQEATWARAGQPGDLVRLVACPDGQKPPPTARSRVVKTSARNGHPEAPKGYAGFNRLWSLQEWLADEHPTGSVLIVDSDMVFRAPVRTVASPGTVVVQEWHAMSPRSFVEPLGSISTAGPERFEPLTWPMVIDAGDLAALMPRWIELTAVLRRTTDMWESDMFALVGALAETDLEIRYEDLGAWMPWPEQFVAGAPILHYCHPVFGRDGSRLWYKQEYSPWDPLGVDPNDAALDYCRDFLHLLDEHIRHRRDGDDLGDWR